MKATHTDAALPLPPGPDPAQPVSPVGAPDPAGSLFHLALEVADLASSVAFYRRFLGTPPARHEPGYARFVLADPGLVLALVEGTGNRRLSHAGLRLPGTDAFSATRERFEQEGLAVRAEANAECCYARADKLWLTDPDGVDWEVYNKHGEAERLSVSGSDCCETTGGNCCKPGEAS